MPADRGLRVLAAMVNAMPESEAAQLLLDGSIAHAVGSRKEEEGAERCQPPAEGRGHATPVSLWRRSASALTATEVEGARSAFFGAARSRSPATPTFGGTPDASPRTPLPSQDAPALSDAGSLPTPLGRAAGPRRRVSLWRRDADALTPTRISGVHVIIQENHQACRSPQWSRPREVCGVGLLPAPAVVPAGTGPDTFEQRLATERESLATLVAEADLSSRPWPNMLRLPFLCNRAADASSYGIEDYTLCSDIVGSATVETSATVSGLPMSGSSGNDGLSSARACRDAVSPRSGVPILSI